MLLLSVAIACMVRLGLSAVLLFGAAGMLDWPHGWAVLFAISGLSSLSQIALAFENPALTRERIHPGPGQPWADRLLRLAISTLFNLWLLAMALEARLRCLQPMPEWLAVPGLGLVLAGQTLSYVAQRVNAFASAVVRIQDESGQATVTGGPYRFIRHPMYAANLLLFSGGALLAGSWAGLAMGVPFAVLFAIRIHVEEQLLLSGLPEYAFYAARVRRRLIPFLW